MNDKTNNIGLEQLQAAVIWAVGNLLRYDSKLVELELHEQAISHRLAVYLERLMLSHSPAHVDCEYNMHLLGEKKARIEPHYYVKKFPPCGCNSCNKLDELEQIQEKEFRPDIIVHTRGIDTNNLIAMEIKKRQRVCPFDLAKLRALTTPKVDGLTYGYRIGVFVKFYGGVAQYLWFMNGNIFQ